MFEKGRAYLHCEEGECFGERLDGREDGEEIDLDGTASLQNGFLSVWRREERVNRLMTCSKEGTMDDILRKVNRLCKCSRRCSSKMESHSVLKLGTEICSSTVDRGLASSHQPRFVRRES